jgi:hypothetical protein
VAFFAVTLFSSNFASASFSIAFPAGDFCVRHQAKQFWWSNISYQYDTEREFVTLTPEFETNDLPFDLELYGFVDFTGDHGHDETNLKNHFGSFDLFKPLNTFGIAEDNIVLQMFDVAMEYNIDTFADDRCYFIGRLNCFSSTWCDIDFDNPLNEYRHDSISGQSMLGVNIWKQLYAFCEVKYEDFQEPFDDAFGLGFGLMWQWYFEKPESATR